MAYDTIHKKRTPMTTAATRVAAPAAAARAAAAAAQTTTRTPLYHHRKVQGVLPAHEVLGNTVQDIQGTRSNVGTST